MCDNSRGYNGMQSAFADTTAEVTERATGTGAAEAAPSPGPSARSAGEG